MKFRIFKHIKINKWKCIIYYLVLHKIILKNLNKKRIYDNYEKKLEKKKDFLENLRDKKAQKSTVTWIFRFKDIVYLI